MDECAVEWPVAGRALIRPRSGEVAAAAGPPHRPPPSARSAGDAVQDERRAAASVADGLRADAAARMDAREREDEPPAAARAHPAGAAGRRADPRDRDADELAPPEAAAAHPERVAA